MKNISQNIIDWIRDYSTTCSNKSLVIGISGGVDSALVSTLCAMTGIKTYLVSMPINQKPVQLELATEHGKKLEKLHDNVTFLNISLDKVFESFSGIMGTFQEIPIEIYDTLLEIRSQKYKLVQEGNYEEAARVRNTEKELLVKVKSPFMSELGLANSKSRLRMITLYQIATSVNGIVVGTGNKVEDFGVGFFTKYGDGGVDISPIGKLTKTQVWELAKELGVSQNILEARPTDGLWDDDRDDETQIGASYEELEWAMDYIEKNSSSELTDRQSEVIKIYNGFHTKNLHKMQSIPVCDPFKKEISIEKA